MCLGCILLGCGGESETTVTVEKTEPPAERKPSSQVFIGPFPDVESDSHALLVACTDYDHLPESANLEGPANDVRLMSRLLREHFKFPRLAIRVLSEASGVRARRPIRANIEREFLDLARRVDPDDRVVIFLSGHGTQQPDDDPDNPDDPEPDGLDEVFCCADIEPALIPGITRAPNGITDDDFRGWLKAIRAKGASVWVIVDACHSGTAVRGTEVLRQIPPEMLLTEEALRAAVPTAATRSIQLDSTSFDAGDDAGGLVAIYAAQPHEPTLEMPLPLGEADAEWYGLLTYTMNQVLTEAESAITYTELVQRVHSAYVALGRIGPTPLIEGGDRHREVLGQKQWPERSRFVLEMGDRGEPQIAAGSLHGLTKGTILAVYPPPGEEDEDKPLGHVKIRKAKPAVAMVEPCRHDGVPKLEKLPLGGRCELVHLDYGSMRLRVAVDADSTTEDVAAKWQAQLDEAAAAQGAVLQHADDPDTADWLVRPTKDGKLLLVPAAGWTETPDGQVPAFGPVAAGDDAIPWLNDRLQRIARAKNLLKIGGTMTAQRRKGPLGPRRGGKKGVRAELRRLDHEDDEGSPIPWAKDGIRFRPGDLLALQVDNPTRHSIDFSVLFVDSGFGIVPLFPPPDSITDNRLPPGESLTVGPMQVEGDSVGLEHLVFVALKSEGQPVDFNWLAQDSIEQARAAGAVNGAERGLDSPLGQLLRTALFADGAQRGLKMADTDSVEMQVISWQTSP